MQFAHSTELVLITAVAAVVNGAFFFFFFFFPPPLFFFFFFFFFPKYAGRCWLIRRIDAETFRRLCISLTPGSSASASPRSCARCASSRSRRVPGHARCDCDRRAAPLSVFLWTSGARDLRIPRAGDQVMHMRLLDRPPAAAPGLDLSTGVGGGKHSYACGCHRCRRRRGRAPRPRGDAHMTDVHALVADQLSAAGSPCATSSFQAESVVLLAHPARGSSGISRFCSSTPSIIFPRRMPTVTRSRSDGG